VTRLSGIVEVDETYVGGKKKAWIPRRGTVGTTPVVSLVERGGKVRSRVMEKVNATNIKAALKEHLQTSAVIMTDDSTVYPKAIGDFKAHKSVPHSQGQYVRGDVHTNTVEGSFSLMKRGIIGTFHSVSKKHLPLDLAEFDHRYNHRKVTDVSARLRGWPRSMASG
jgi:hypothetical protein